MARPAKRARMPKPAAGINGSAVNRSISEGSCTAAGVLTGVLKGVLAGFPTGLGALAVATGPVVTAVTATGRGPVGASAGATVGGAEEEAVAGVVLGAVRPTAGTVAVATAGAPVVGDAIDFAAGAIAPAAASAGAAPNLARSLRFLLTSAVRLATSWLARSFAMRSI